MQLALWQACDAGDLETLRTIVERHPDHFQINYPNPFGKEGWFKFRGCTGLHIAIMQCPTWKRLNTTVEIELMNAFVREFFGLLFRAGADVNMLCGYQGEWYMEFETSKTPSFTPKGYNALNIALEFLNVTFRAGFTFAASASKLELVRDVLVDRVRNMPSRLSLNVAMAAERSLSAELAEALAKGTFADFTIRVGDGFAQPVHRVVLGARSPVLEAMLRGGSFKEAALSELVLDFDVAVVKLFIRFIYTDTLDACVEHDVEMACRLLELANRYDMQGMVLQCSRVIMTHHLNVASAPGILRLADDNCAAHLRAVTLDYIADNISAVMASAAFEQLPLALVQEVLKSVVGGGKR